MADVARLAGVSKQTVSRVLNDHPHVRPETRERVEDAVKALAYRRDASARALATRRSGLLGLLAFDATGHIAPGTLLGMQQVARDSGYFVSIASLSSTSSDPLEQALDQLYHQAAEGLVVIASTRAAVALLDDLPAELPIVTVEGPGVPRGDAIGFDQQVGARAASEHLLALGHRTVHHVAGPAHRLDAAGRMAGWRAALEDAGRDVPQPIIGDWTPRSGYAAAKQLLERGGMTALLAASDQMALGALKALHDDGGDAARQVSVVGFDDMPVSEFSVPPLTTVRQDFLELGRQSVSMLVDRIDDPDRSTRRVLLTPRLVVRESTAPPPPPSTRRT